MRFYSSLEHNTVKRRSMHVRDAVNTGWDCNRRRDRFQRLSHSALCTHANFSHLQTHRSYRLKLLICRINLPNYADFKSLSLLKESTIIVADFGYRVRFF